MHRSTLENATRDARKVLEETSNLKASSLAVAHRRCRNPAWQMQIWPCSAGLIPPQQQAEGGGGLLVSRQPTTSPWRKCVSCVGCRADSGYLTARSSTRQIIRRVSAKMGRRAQKISLLPSISTGYTIHREAGLLRNPSTTSAFCTRFCGGEGRQRGGGPIDQQINLIWIRIPLLQTRNANPETKQRANEVGKQVFREDRCWPLILVVTSAGCIRGSAPRPRSSPIAGRNGPATTTRF